MGATVPQIDLLNGHLYAAEPDRTYRWLRDEAPLYYDDINNLYGVSRYADVVAAETQPRRYSNRNAYRPITVHDPDADLAMINFDDPRHLEQRRVVHRRFTPKAAASHTDLVQARVTALLDKVAAEGECDAVRDLAAPLPAMMIAHYIGFGIDRWADVCRWSEKTIPFGGGDRYLDDSSLETVFEFAAAVLELVELRRREPADDLITSWLNAEVDGRPMTEAEIVSECLLLVDGGAETTRTVIANIIWALCEHPDQRRALLEQPELLDGPAVEEFIRWTSPILNMARVVTEKHSLHGTTLNPGDRLLLMYSSANRDERAFAAPDTFDVSRRTNNHVAFGFGTHFCLGASLARLELRLFFAEFLRRLGDFRIEGPTPTRIPGAFVRGINDYRISFTPEPAR